MNANQGPSTRPYLIRALFEWCMDAGFTPYLAVQAGEGVQVPHEFVKNGEIVLNISPDATSGLLIGNEWVEFKARFNGVAREIMVPFTRARTDRAWRFRRRRLALLRVRMRTQRCPQMTPRHKAPSPRSLG
jgi:hypothetical protein